MTSKHTPGPWVVIKLASPDYAPEFGIYAEGSQRDLARIVGDNSEANAKLIAAAPRLLAALQLLEALVSAGQPPGTEDLGQARAAITEALGEFP